MAVESVSVGSSLSVVSQIVIANEAWQSHPHVIASEAWQSHKKKCFLSLKDFYVFIGKNFPYEIAAPFGLAMTMMKHLNSYAFIGFALIWQG